MRIKTGDSNDYLNYLSIFRIQKALSIGSKLILFVLLFTITKKASCQKSDSLYVLVDTAVNDLTPVKRIKITQADTIQDRLTGTIWLGFNSTGFKRILDSSLSEYFFRDYHGYNFFLWEVNNVNYKVGTTVDLNFDPYIFYDNQTQVYFGGDDVRDICATCPTVQLKGNIDSEAIANLDKNSSFFFIHSKVDGEADYYKTEWHWEGFHSGFRKVFLGRQHFFAGEIFARCYINSTGENNDSLHIILISNDALINDVYYKGNYILYEKRISIYNTINYLGFDFVPKDKIINYNGQFHIDNVRFSAHNNMKDEDFMERLIMLSDYHISK